MPFSQKKKSWLLRLRLSKKANAMLDLQPCENVGWKAAHAQATAIHYHQKLFVIEWAH